MNILINHFSCLYDNQLPFVFTVGNNNNYLRIKVILFSLEKQTNNNDYAKHHKINLPKIY